MFKEKRILFLIAETPVHPGSGSEVGIVDLPIQRERHTEFPKIESSGLKGCIREAFEKLNPKVEINNKKVHPKDEIKYKDNGKEKKTDYISLVFGPEGEEAHAGAMTITDARILLFPVKSLKGVFAWITCPFVLERFKKDLELIGIDIDTIKNINSVELENTVPKECTLIIPEKKIVLEEFTFKVREDDSTTELAQFLAKSIFDESYQFWKERLEKNFVILSNDDFTQFVKTSTEVITRTKIDSATGTVESGALWTEEYLPQDTIMYSLVMFTQSKVKNDDQKGIFQANSPEEEARLVAEFFEKGLPEVIQVGGNQTIGKGFMRTKIYSNTVTKEG